MVRKTLLAAAVLATVGMLGYCALGGGLFCAVSERPSGPEEAAYVAQLRNRGPEGLTEALTRYDQFIELSARMGVDLNEPQPADENDEHFQLAAEGRARLQDIVDRVAGQRDAWMSRLYWYTDFDQAKAAAAESGKPILSLRMLGNLTDEFSCANSRFFRTALYANQAVSELLRDHFVLHWQSVRPVPRVTIDFGDGRKLERTITGNSAHYVLDATGRPLDVLPGLYSPQEFQAWLARMINLAAAYAAADVTQQDDVLQRHHEKRGQALMHNLYADLQAAAPEYLNLQRVRAGIEFFDRPPYEEVWRRIAEHRRGEIALDESSVALIRAEHPTAFQAGAAAVSKRVIEDPVLRIVRSFEGSLALDTVRNEYQLHRMVHVWYVRGEAPRDYDALNERVYAELFLTPTSDPWLGLAPIIAYTGLIDGGLSRADAEPSQPGSAQ